MARALQHADRPTIMEHLRSCFKNFLEALDIGQVDEEVSWRCRVDLNHSVLIILRWCRRKPALFQHSRNL